MADARSPGRAWLDEQLAQLDPRWTLLGVLALIFLAYAPTLGFGLVYDDGWVLITNGFLREPDLALLLSPEGSARHVPDVFRPTSVLFDLLSYRLLGLNAAAHHALSVGLHLGVCALAYAFVRRIGGPRDLALAGCAAYGVMGLHAEVVSVVSYREDMLALGFALAAAWAASDALRGAPGRRWAPALAAVVLAALAAGAKLSVALLPLAWALIEWMDPFGRREARAPRRAAILALAALLALGVALALAQRYAVSGSGGLSPYAGDNPRLLAARPGIEGGAILAASAQIHLAYLAQMLVPVGLSPEYADFTSHWRAPASLLALGVFAGLVSFVVYAFVGAGARPALRRVALALLVAALLALPTANLVAMPNMRADRFTYASSLPIAFALAGACVRLGERLAARSEPAWVLAPLLVWMVVQASLAFAASSVYASNRSLWAAAEKRAPGSARTHAMLGLTRLQTAGRRAGEDPQILATVRRDCGRALALDRLEELAHVCMARAAASEGRAGAWVEARSRFARAVELAPDHEGVWLAALAQAELELLTPETASAEAKAAASARSEAWIRRAKAEYPYLAEVQLVDARLALRRGDAQAARESLGRARSLRPERWETVLALVELQLDLGHVPGAYAIWRQEATVLAGADPIARDHMLSRLRDAQRLGLRPDPIPLAEANPAPSSDLP